MSNKTAMQWFVEQLPIRILNAYRDEIEKAYKMEDEQLQETFKQSRQCHIFEDGMPPVHESFEEYYKQTFGKNVE